MEESQVTVFGETFPLESPFMVLATQNPIELEEPYPLPEAQAETDNIGADQTLEALLNLLKKVPRP